MMPCAEIVRGAFDGLELLSTTMHDVPARHKSLEVVFDHSWQLLSKPERAAFKKLSVFRGGFDRQAAKDVAGASLSTLAVLVTSPCCAWSPLGATTCLSRSNSMRRASWPRCLQKMRGYRVDMVNLMPRFPAQCASVMHVTTCHLLNEQKRR